MIASAFEEDVTSKLTLRAPKRGMEVSSDG